MGEQTFNPVVLSNLVKLIGVVVTWGTTIYFLWVKTPPPVISSQPFYDQVRRITMLVISVFLILSWGVFGNTASLHALESMAIALTAFGIVVFFTVVGVVHRVTAGQRSASAVPLLIGFFAYSTTISVGLTSAVEFLAVVLLNPSNAAAGQSVVSNTVYAVRATLDGTQSVRQDDIVPFQTSSGQGNVGCGETLARTAAFHLPAGAIVVGQPTVTWANFSNLRSTVVTPVQIADGEVMAGGQALGLEYQEFKLPFAQGIRNCPGGGHGEVVISGSYKATSTHSQSKAFVLTNTVSAGQNGPVWVSLPSQKDWTLERGVVEFVPQSDPSAPKASLTVTPATPAAQSEDGKFRVELQIQQGRFGLTIGR